ncbi:serine protease inhibitor swm-1-like isoform X1 [Engystomops pustulosus]|uniref:serine protease inhibitor swm-1-like isoform X1 n=1 Tax=Engystomops pustulosus TaxID=76066 RepID=UPI003AFB2255
MWKLSAILLLSALALHVIDAHDQKPPGYKDDSYDSDDKKLPENGEQRCPKGKAWNNCGSSCPTNCDNKEDKKRICTMNCVPGCFCSSPHIFLSGTSGPCVLPEECPKKNPTPIVQKCPKNQVWNDCGSACPTTCDNVGIKGRICTMNCVRGCVCQSPYILSGESGSCVLPEQCPKKDPTPIKKH